MYKIGQRIRFNSDFTIDLANGKTAKVRKGDEATVVKKVDSNSGEIVYNTGEAKGYSQIISIQVDDNVDADYIAKQILKNL
ncbi:MAG: hypothetical protein AB6733_04025 [Clostridiaceae bacterium]